MRQAIPFLLLAAACASGTDPGSQYYGLSQVQAEAVTDELVQGGVGPILPLAPPTVGSGLVEIPVAVTTDCPESGAISLSGTLRGTASNGAAALLLSAGESVNRCVIRIEDKTYELNGVPVLSLGGFINYLNGVMVNTQSFFINGTVQVVGGQGAQAICPVDIIVTVTGWSPDVRAQGTVCQHGIDQTVTVSPGAGGNRRAWTRRDTTP
jgi:hypothetical protein